MDPVRSVASAPEIASLVAQTFDVEVRRCEFWFAFWWDEYQVTAADGRWRLRIARSVHRNYGELQADAALACARAGLPVTLPAETSTHSRWTLIDFAEGSRSALLLPPEDGTLGTWDDVGRLGSLLASVHNATDDLAHPGIKSWSPRDLAGEDDEWLRRLYEHEVEDRDYMVRYRQQALARTEDSAGSDTGFLHGEVYPAAMYQTSKRDLRVGTFEYCGYGSRIYDLATLRWALELHMRQDAERLFDGFVSEYRSQRPIAFDDDDLRAWVALRHLWAFRLGWLLSKELGLAGLTDPAGLAKRVKFARHWAL